MTRRIEITAEMKAAAVAQEAREFAEMSRRHRGRELNKAGVVSVLCGWVAILVAGLVG